MSDDSTVRLVDRDLSDAAVELRAAEEALIAALEGGARLADVVALEAAVAACTARRDDAASTKVFVVNRERDRAARDGKRLSSVLYLSRWGRSFAPGDVGALVAASNARNEASGLTGVLFVFRGWFASYIEGEEAALDRTLQAISRDPRHEALAVLSREVGLPPHTPRLFPSSGLALRRLDSPDVNHRTATDAAVAAAVFAQLSLTAFVPRPLLSTRQEAERRNLTRPIDDVALAIAVAASRAPITSSDGGSVPSSAAPSSSSSFRGAPATLVTRLCLLRVAPSEAFWTDGRPPADVARDAARVHAIVRRVVERGCEDWAYQSAGGGGTRASTSARHHQGTVLGPHGCEGVVAAVGADAGVALERALAIFERLRCGRAAANASGDDSGDDDSDVVGEADGGLFSRYAPLVALHIGDVESVMDGACTACGPSLRYLRQVATVGRQEGYPVVCSEAFADAAGRRGLASARHFLFDRRPDEVFVPTQTASLRWDSATQRLEAQRADPRRQLGDAAAEGGVPQFVADAAAARAAPPKRVVSADEHNAKPVPGMPTTAELRATFDALRPSLDDDTVSMLEFSKLYYAADTMGVAEYVGDMEKEAAKYAAGPGAGRVDRVTFDQFCIIWYRRLKK